MYQICPLSGIRSEEHHTNYFTSSSWGLVFSAAVCHHPRVALDHPDQATTVSYLGGYITYAPIKTSGLLTCKVTE